MINLWEIFSYKIVKEQWLPLIEEIVKHYQQFLKKTPNEIQAKNLRNFGILFTY